MSDDENDDADAPATTAEETASDAHVPARWQPGMPSPNPKGRPKQPRSVKEVRELAREKTVQMIEVLSRVALNPKSPPAARAAAASSILDRAWGKPAGDFGDGAEGLVIRVIKFGEQIEPEIKTIEHESAELTAQQEQKEPINGDDDHSPAQLGTTTVSASSLGCAGKRY